MCKGTETDDSTRGVRHDAGEQGWAASDRRIHRGWTSPQWGWEPVEVKEEVDCASLCQTEYDLHGWGSGAEPPGSQLYRLSAGNPGQVTQPLGTSVFSSI